MSYLDFVDADQSSRKDPLAEPPLVLHPIVPHAQLLESIAVVTSRDVPIVSDVEQNRHGQRVFANKDLQVKRASFSLQVFAPSLGIIGLERSQIGIEESPVGEAAVDRPGYPGVSFVGP